MNISDLHDCEKSHGKMVLIATDKSGNTCCGYCHEKVDYRKIFTDIRFEESRVVQKIREMKNEHFQKSH